MSGTIRLVFRQSSKDKKTASFRIESAASGQAWHKFILPWQDPDEWSAVYLYLKAFREQQGSWAKINPTIKKIAITKGLADQYGTPLDDRAKVVGKELYKAVFKDDIAKKELQQGLECRSQDVPSPSLVEMHFEAEGHFLQTYPWEVMHDEQGFLFDTRGAALVRYVDFPKPIKKGGLLVKRLNVFVVDPCPKEYGEPGTRGRDALVELLSQADDHIKLQLHLAAPTLSSDLNWETCLDALDKALKKAKDDGSLIHAVHIEAHGRFGKLHCGDVHPHSTDVCGCGVRLTQPPQGYVAFAAKGKTQWISGQKLASIFRNQGVRLVVLSVCDSGVVGGGSVFNSMAGALLQGGIPAVVAMQFPVEIESNRTFVYSFYRSVLDELPMADAVARARTSLLAADEHWYRPTLYLRTELDDPRGKLFGPSSAESLLIAGLSDWKHMHHEAQALLGKVELVLDYLHRGSTADAHWIWVTECLPKLESINEKWKFKYVNRDDPVEALQDKIRNLGDISSRLERAAEGPLGLDYLSRQVGDLKARLFDVLSRADRGIIEMIDKIEQMESRKG